MSRFAMMGATIAALSLLSGSALAAPVTFTYTVGGFTTGSGSGPYTLTSTDSTYSVLRAINNETFNFSDVTNINIDYTALLGGIGGGAPRLVVVTDADHDGIADGDFSILFGPAGSFADPTLGASNTGNFITMNDLGRYDLGDLGGPFYSDYATALATAGSFGVLRFSLILDSFGGADKTFVIPESGIHVSANVGGAVPEPSVWALMLAGFGIVGFELRRRRRGSVAI